MLPTGASALGQEQTHALLIGEALNLLVLASSDLHPHAVPVAIRTILYGFLIADSQR
jgi:hypothetical protein